MSDRLYVPTGPSGIEHTAGGLVHWTLPGGDPTVAPTGRTLSIRHVAALLDVLEAEIYEAEPVGEVIAEHDGVVTVTAARLLRRTAWDMPAATLFAIDCAAHAVVNSPAATLPDGTELGAILDAARRAVDGRSDDGVERLHHWARVSALRHVRHDRDRLAQLSQRIVIDDELHDVDALDDARYTSIIPVTDAVLAAIEALDHQMLPHLATYLEDGIEERLEEHNLDRRTPFGTPTFIETPIGSAIIGAPAELPFSPAWACAREAARHARLAVRDLDGEGREADETVWQVARLEAVIGERTDASANRATGTESTRPGEPAS